LDFGKWIRNTQNLLKCGAAEGGRSVVQIVNKCRSVTNSQEGAEYPANNKKEGRLTALVTPCIELPSKTCY
jgi:hypothetical protein